jgi:GNAT superfamily N-acetyltransferase
VPDPAQAAVERGSVRELRDEHRERAVRALARAFLDDPVLSWFFRDDYRRAARLEAVFAFMGSQVWFGHGLSYTTGGVVGAAIWVPPELWRVSLLDQLRMTPGFVSSVGWRALPRALRGFNLMESKHPHDRHYYLPIVGVEPSWQGMGLGTALLQPVLERCDREGAAAYLEATSPRNRSCYERAGFEVIDEFSFPRGPQMWPMRREPRPG